MALLFSRNVPFSGLHHPSAPEPDECDAQAHTKRKNVSHREPLELLMLSTGSERDLMIHNTLLKGAKLASGL